MSKEKGKKTPQLSIKEKRAQKREKTQERTEQSRKG